jgi:hypothetical protein
MFAAVRITAAEDRRFLFIVSLFPGAVLGRFEGLQAVKHTRLFIC